LYELRNGSQEHEVGPTDVPCLWASKCRIPDEFHRAGTSDGQVRNGTGIDRGRGSHVRCNAGVVESAVREAEALDEALQV